MKNAYSISRLNLILQIKRIGTVLWNLYVVTFTYFDAADKTFSLYRRHLLWSFLPRRTLFWQAQITRKLMTCNALYLYTVLDGVRQSLFLTVKI
jgi:hypothetical protein